MPQKTQNQFINWFLARPARAGLITFLILLSVVTVTLYQRHLFLKENDRREMQNVVNVVYKNMDQTLKNSVTAALSLALTINDDGVPENFEDIGRQLISSNSGIDAVQLVPDGVISYVYPYEENKAALGLDILKPGPHRAEALKSIQYKKMYFAGPLKLKQGGMGVVGRIPVYINQEFWGFSAVVIKLETLVQTAGIKSLDESKYYFQLSKPNPDTGREEFFLPGNSDFSGAYFEQMTFPDSDWNLYIIASESNDYIVELLPLAIFGILLALLFALMIVEILRKPAELQKMVHEQAENLMKKDIQFKAIFDNAAIGIAYIDSNSGRILGINDNYARMLGYPIEELIGKTFIEISHEDDLPQDLENMKLLLEGKIRQFSMEKRLVHRDGKVFWVSLTVSPLWQPGEAPSSHIALVEDIDERYNAKQLISKSEAHFKSLFENSPIALWEEDFSAVRNYLDQKGLMGKSPKEVMRYFTDEPAELDRCISLVRIIDVNTECILLNAPRTKSEIISQGLTPIINPANRQSMMKQFVAITSGRNAIAMDTQTEKPEGMTHIHLRWGVMRGYENTFERVIISSEDVTQQKISQQLISNTQKRIESLVNTIDGIVWECDFETYAFTYINKKAEDITGYTNEEWFADPMFWANTIHPDDREEAVSFCATNAREKKQYAFEYRMIAKDGSILWIRDIVNVIYEGSKPVSLRGIMIDITKTKEAERDLSKSFELVTEQNKRLHNFSYIVSHNLRSHTANIQSISSLIESADSDEERLELINMLKTVSGSLNDTMVHLNDLLNIKASVDLSREELNLGVYINNTMTVLSEQITSRNAIIENNIPGNISLLYNPAYLESILLNLFSNALRYSHPDRIPKITIEWLGNEGKNCMKFRDNGIGIDLKRNGDKLFGMYKTFNGNPDARGIGLFITRNQIEAMGGTISVESEPGVGTAFTICFR